MTEPKILLDATAIPASRTGVGRYVDHLVAALDMGGASLSVVCQRRDAQTLAGLAPGSRIVPIANITFRPARLAWEQVGLPRLARRLAVDVLHSPHYTMPLTSPVPTVVTLHDATFFSDRSLHSGVKGRFFRGWTKVSLRRAAVCVAPSRATAAELCRLAGAGPASLMVAYHGVDRAFFYPPSASQVAEFRERLALGDRSWIAFLGTLEPRKNVPSLIRAYGRVFRGMQDSPALVLAGGDGWDDQVAPAIAQIPDGLRVIRTGHAPIETLPALLGGADIVCYPSLGEGFGLPVLEAMACRTAVLTTRRLALPEVGGDAVAYSDVTESSIGQSLIGLYRDPGYREQLSTAAVDRAATFTWEACATEHLKAYQRAIAEAGR